MWAMMQKLRMRSGAVKVRSANVLTRILCVRGLTPWSHVRGTCRPSTSAEVVELLAATWWSSRMFAPSCLPADLEPRHDRTSDNPWSVNMNFTPLPALTRRDAATAVLAAKKRLGLAWAAIAQTTKQSTEWTTSALLG